MKHYGDVSKIEGSQVEPVDIITFGSPCQDLSVAGKRAGIQDGERSNLFFEAIRIIKEMREATNGEYPKYAVWENVPGAFSSNKGWDFHAVLEAFCAVKDDTVSIPEPYDAKRTRLVWNKAGEIVGDNYSIAWRTLDAQYWGVPQRRKRIYLVADFRGQRAGEILFKPDSLRGDMQEGNEAGQGVTVDAVGSVDRSVGVNGNNCLTPYDVQSRRCFSADGAWPALYGGEGGGHGYVLAPKGSVDGSVGVFNESGIGYWMPGYGCLRAEGENRPSRPTHTIVQSAGFCQGASPAAQTIGYQEEIAPTVKGAPSGTAQVPAVCYPLNEQIILRHGALGKNTGFGAGEDGDPAYTLQANHPHAVCYDARNHNAQDISGTIQAKSNGGQSLNYINPVCYDARGNGDGETACTITGDHQNRITDYTAGAVQETLCFDETQITSPTNGNNPRWNEPSHPLASTARPPTVICKKPPRKYIIRRLTPTECARLQGFPDNWGELATYDGDDAFWEQVRKTYAEINGKAYKPTKNPKAWYQKLHNDGAEYKMWGNGIALPNARYVIQGIAEQGAKTLGSLFDGSGGFPLAGAMNGITPIWASEVEPYPIAVTKSRFKEVNDG